jgi:hypothetical protein
MISVVLFCHFINEINQNANTFNNQLTIDIFSFMYFGAVYFSKAMQKWTLTSQNFDVSKRKWEGKHKKQNYKTYFSVFTRVSKRYLTIALN